MALRLPFYQNSFSVPTKKGKKEVSMLLFIFIMTKKDLKCELGMPGMPF